jgi:hypothetical protein
MCKNHACIASQLTSILKKKSFVWNLEVTIAFSRLKYFMISTIALGIHGFDKTFIVKCNASIQGIGEILMQDGEN